jgi:hypothetical protein
MKLLGYLLFVRANGALANRMITETIRQRISSSGLDAALA